MELSDCRGGPPLVFGLLDVFLSDRSKRCANRQLADNALPTLRCGWIGASARQRPRRITGLACGREGDVRIFTKGKFPFDAVRPIFHPPKTAPGRRHEKIETSAVGELVGALA